MKSIYIICVSYILLLTFGACKSDASAKQDVDTQTSEHNHSHDGHDHAHDHDGHDHDHEGHNHDHEGHDHEGHDHDHNHDEAQENEIVFTTKQAISVGLELEEVKLGEINQVIRTGGQILSAQGDEITISASVNGIISFNKASLNEGTAVKAGESLLSISSKNMLEGDPIALAKNRYNTAKLEFDRAESLIVDKLISEVEYNTIKLEYQNAKEAYSDFSGKHTSKGTGMASSITGFVKTKLVSEGQFVEVGQPLMTITQNKRLQLRADVSERYYSNLGSITSANFKTPYDGTTYSLTGLNGKLTSYGRSVSTDNYYLPVNFEFDNIGHIVPGSYVDVYLISGKKENAISVPVTSLVEDQGVFFVFTQLDAEGYERQEVKLGVNDGTRVEILSGLKQGQKVVTKGAIHVKLASVAEAMPHGHAH